MPNTEKYSLSNVILRHNTGNKDKDLLLNEFVVRTDEFSEIFNEIKSTNKDKPQASILIVGQRGSGKTTLIYKLKYEIEDSADLNEWLVPIVFSEEQYDINELVDVWVKIAEYLDDQLGWSGLTEDLNNILKGRFTNDQIIELLKQWLEVKKKRTIVFIENLNILFKKLTKDDITKLKEVFTTSRYFRLVGSSSVFNDSTVDFNTPPYNFFKIVSLDGLTSFETKKLLLKIAEQFGQTESIKRVVKKNPKRLESLRRLTGGLPRTITYLFQIFLDNENGKAVLDLKQLIDDVSVLYKAKLDELSPQQQKIVDVIAKSWDPITTKEIAVKTRIDSKHVSSILQQLEKNQLIEKIPTKTKNFLYGIKERFLNIWYLMRFGSRHSKIEVLWLVKFYETWCDRTELAQRIINHIANLKKGGYDVEAAVFMGKTFLFCDKVSGDLKYDLLEVTKSILPKNLKVTLDIPDQHLLEAARKLISSKKANKAKEVLDQIKNKENLSFYITAAHYYIINKEYDTGIEFLLKAYKENNSKEIANTLADLYRLKNDYSNCIKYLTKAVQQDDFEAAHRLGHVYAEDLSDFKKAEKYFLIAIENNSTKAIFCYGKLLAKQKRYKEAEDYFLKSISLGNNKAYISIGLLNERQSKFDLAETYYKKAIEHEVFEGLVNLGNLYLIKPEKDVIKAKTYLEQAIEKGLKDGFLLLGRLLWYEEKDSKAAKKILTKAIQKGAYQAHHTLAHIYEKETDIKNAVMHFKKAINTGDDDAIYCLTFFSLKNNLSEEKEYLLNVYSEHIEDLLVNDKHAVPLFALVQIWNEDVEGGLNTLKQNKESIEKEFEKLESKDSDVDLIIDTFTQFFTYLIAKGEYKNAYNLFTQQDNYPSFKKILKPMYYSLMFFMQDEYPQEYLKVGDELKETVDEILTDIEEVRNRINSETEVR